jgi:hypothetical protein
MVTLLIVHYEFAKIANHNPDTYTDTVHMATAVENESLSSSLKKQAIE